MSVFRVRRERASRGSGVVAGRAESIESPAKLRDGIDLPVKSSTCLRRKSHAARASVVERLEQPTSQRQGGTRPQRRAAMLSGPADREKSERGLQSGRSAAGGINRDGRHRADQRACEGGQNDISSGEPWPGPVLWSAQAA